MNCQSVSNHNFNWSKMIIKLYPRKFDIAEKRKQDETLTVFKFVDKAGHFI